MKSDGFTLLEIITTFSLIGILLLFCVPKIASDFCYMDRVVDEILADVRFIQMEAMKYPKPKYQITVISKERKYYLKDEYKVIKMVNFNDRYNIEYTGNGALYFKLNGTPVNAGTFTIVDTKTNNSKSVTIVPATGRTIISE